MVCTVLICAGLLNANTALENINIIVYKLYCVHFHFLFHSVLYWTRW